MDARARLIELLDERIVVLDGAWGVLLQNRGLSEQDFRGERFAAHPRDVKGDPDLLNLTQPEIVEAVHRSYLDAGADITTTNTFTATSIGQADYGLEDAVYELNVEGARIARRVADEVGGRFVAGSVGPLNVTLSLSPRVDEPAYRTHTFDQVSSRTPSRCAASSEGGVDVLLIETIFDTLNAKAAIVAAQDVAPELPLWLSLTVVDLSGRNLSGQTPEAFWIVGRARRPADRRRQLLARRRRRCGRSSPTSPPSSRPTSAAIRTRACRTRSAATTSTRTTRAACLRGFAEDGLVNVVGGCCGTTPEHIAADRGRDAGSAPRQLPQRNRRPRFSGLEPFVVGQDTGFAIVGERTNVTGSTRFRGLIEGGDFQGAVAVALDQVRGGANVLDVNMDADLLDSEEAMTTFLNLIATEPEVARIPIMIDSSRCRVLEAGLKCVQGKPIVNSLSLKEGEEAFLAQARIVRRYGARRDRDGLRRAGPGDRRRPRVAICGRAYDLLLAEGWLARGHHLRPEHPGRRDRDRGARRYAKTSSRRCR